MIPLPDKHEKLNSQSTHMDFLKKLSNKSEGINMLAVLQRWKKIIKQRTWSDPFCKDGKNDQAANVERPNHTLTGRIAR